MSTEQNWEKMVVPASFDFPWVSDWHQKYRHSENERRALEASLVEAEKELLRRRQIIAAVVAKAGGAVRLTWTEQDDAFDLPLDCYCDARDDVLVVRTKERNTPAEPVPE